VLVADVVVSAGGIHEALFGCPLPGRECGPTHGGHPAREEFHPKIFLLFG
jgi:hypothetical protein